MSILMKQQTGVRNYEEEALKALEICKKLLAEDGIALPSDSWLSGQAFASMVAGKNIVINDIDVFKVSNYRNLGSDNMIQKNYSRIELTTSSYGMWISAKNAVKYKVVATTHVGMMNLTNIEFEDEVKEAMHGITLIDYFDINSTQCAINTTTKEVVYTKEFERYCESNTLEITNLSTIGHSLIRLVKKADELKAECNFAKEFDKFLGVNFMKNPFFGEKHYAIYLKYKNVFDEYGVVPEEYDYEDRKYPLYRMTRFSSPLQRWIVKALDKMDNLRGNKYHQSSCIQNNLVRSSDFFFGKSTAQIENDVVKIMDLEEKEKLLAKSLDDEFPFAEKFYSEILSMKNGKEELKRLYQAINEEELFFATVYNGSETFSEALEWIDVLNNPLAKRYIKEKAKIMIDSDNGFITIEEVMNNLDPFTVDEFVDSVPSIGESDSNKAGIVAVFKNYYIIEMEQNKIDIEIFGLELIEGKEPFYNSRKISFQELYDAQVFQTPTAFIDSNCKVINEGDVRDYITPRQISEIDLDSEEIPF